MSIFSSSATFSFGTIYLLCRKSFRAVSYNVLNMIEVDGDMFVIVQNVYAIRKEAEILSFDRKDNFCELSDKNLFDKIAYFFKNDPEGSIFKDFDFMFRDMAYSEGVRVYRNEEPRSFKAFNAKDHKNVSIVMGRLDDRCAELGAYKNIFSHIIEGQPVSVWAFGSNLQVSVWKNGRPENLFSTI